MLIFITFNSKEKFRIPLNGPLMKKDPSLYSRKAPIVIEYSSTKQSYNSHSNILAIKNKGKATKVKPAMK